MPNKKSPRGKPAAKIVVHKSQSVGPSFVGGTGMLGSTEPGQVVTAQNIGQLPCGSVVKGVEGGRLIHLHDVVWLWLHDGAWCYTSDPEFRLNLMKNPTVCHLPPKAGLSFSDLSAANSKRGAEWDKKPADLADISFRAMELGGESGEAAEALLHMIIAVGKAQNISKKIIRHEAGRVGGISPSEAHGALGEELADVVICADRIAEVMNIDLGAATREKFNKTSRKYGLKEML